MSAGFVYFAAVFVASFGVLCVLGAEPGTVRRSLPLVGFAVLNAAAWIAVILLANATLR